MSFFNELQRRNVLRVAAAYIVASWLIIQVVETLFPARDAEIVEAAAQDEAFVWFEKASKEFPRHYVAYEPYANVMMKDPRWEPAREKFESQYVESDQ